MDTREKIEIILREPDIGCVDWNQGKSILENWKRGLPDQILSLLKEEGWVQLDSDQGLPAIDEETYSPLYVMAYSTVKRAMLNAGFKKVKE